MKKYSFLLLLVNFLMSGLISQTLYPIDAAKTNVTVRSGQLKMGNPGPDNRQILINNRYMTIAGRPVLPVMGEIHYSRIPRDQWEDVILKMKACGVNIIAFYLIWIHHEEIEGQFDWTGNKDLRAFVQLCQKHGMYVYPRLGPWSHAEVRNGGFPDWLLAKKNIHVRSNDSVYKFYADEWYHQIALQLKGLMYKDGGPIIGAQLENEYGRGKGGESYIMWLKHTAQKYGIDVPMYTVTGWGNGSVPPYEVIPMWGAYPDEPWGTNLKRNISGENFQFTPFRDDDKIGNDVNNGKKPYLDYSAYPYFTCEVGVGIENTDHRRLEIGGLDGPALVMAKLGSGSNLIGYYMFAGGSNPHGKLTSLEETQTSGSWNTNPVVSYDFQAAIRENGDLNASYFQIKQLHYFLNEYGDRLAPMETTFPKQPEDLQYTLRSSGDAAFLFGINYCRHNIKAVKSDVQFRVKLPDESITFPSKGIDIPDSSLFIWPINFKMDKLLLKYATSQPLCTVKSEGIQNWIFANNVDETPEFCIDEKSVERLDCSTGKVLHQNGHYYIRVSSAKSGINYINVTTKDGGRYRLIILSKNKAKDAWLFNGKKQKHFYLSNSGIYQIGDSLHLFGNTNTFQLATFQKINLKTLAGTSLKPSNDGTFNNYKSTTTLDSEEATLKAVPVLGNAKWLRTAETAVTPKTALYNRLFCKEFKISNPSAIQSATLFIDADSKCGLRINNSQLNQDIAIGKLSRIDVTGYLRNGNNDLLFNFRTDTGKLAFIARIVINYLNYDREEILTDTSWLTTTQYSFPSYPYKLSKFNRAEVDNDHKKLSTADSPTNEYHIYVKAQNGYNADFKLGINYAADKARLYANGRLVADDFYNGTLWQVGLSHIERPLNGFYTLVLLPLERNYRKYFDRNVSIPMMEKGIVHSVDIIPRYKLDLITN